MHCSNEGIPWVPKCCDRICSKHFVGNKKSDDPRSPSYNPTIFPKIYNKCKINKKNLLSRYQRFKKRNLSVENLTVNSSKKIKTNMLAGDKIVPAQIDYSNSDEIVMENHQDLEINQVTKKDQSIQV